MGQLTVTYWRDIPSQVTVKQGRRQAKRMLSDRFQEAIDMAAMRSGAAQTDDYLAEWRRGTPEPVDGGLDEAADAVSARLEAAFDHNALKLLIDNGGHAN